MKKQFSIYTAISAFILFIVLHISSWKALLIEEYTISFIFFIVSTLCMFFSMFFVNEYKYFSGKLTHSQFKKHYNYEYYYMIYGDKSYNFYLEKYK
tara:strand:- start:17571 stop:17858 length:288 start_codon:yes stop_codon:yes gene_type:complete